MRLQAPTLAAPATSAFWQHWTRLTSRRNAVGLVYCEQHHEQMLALRTITQRRGETVIQFVGGHAVRLSPSAARDRYCATCLRRPHEVEAGGSLGGFIY